MAKLLNYAITKEYKWYAIYTRLNHEKAVEAALIDQKIEVFLPKKKILRKWSDRMKWVEEPLFRPYIFVNVSNKEYHEVLQVPSALFYICFEGRAAPIPEDQIELMKRVINDELPYEVTSHKFKPKQKVNIMHGPFKGYEVEVVFHKGKSRLLVLIEQLNCSMLIDVNADYLRFS